MSAQLHTLPAHLVPSAQRLQLIQSAPPAGTQLYQRIGPPRQVVPTPADARDFQRVTTDSPQSSDDDDDLESAGEDESEKELLKQEIIEEAKHQARMQAARKRLASEPDGNLYRGWAVGIQKGPRQFWLTVLVICVQLIGPLVMCIWGHLELANGEVDDLWTYMTPDCSSFSPKDFDVCDKPSKCYLVILHKMLGAVLMMVLYLNGDAILDRMDRQDDRLRELYPTLKTRWMFLDSFCNSWCVMVSAFATPMLVFASHDAKDLVLDAFGLLFLQSIDDYSANIEFGIETSDFDELIDLREIELEEEKNRLLRDDTPKTQTTPNRPSWNNVIKRCLEGDFCFIFARFVNQAVGCFAVPCYLLIHWHPLDAPSACLCGGAAETTMSRFEITEAFLSWRVIVIGSCVLGCVFLKNACTAWTYYRASKQDFDCVSCCWQVLLSGRGDPRQDDPDKLDDDL